VDEIGILGLAAAADARVPGDGMPRPDGFAMPARLGRRRRDLELALAIADRPALPVIAPAIVAVGRRERG
jgi:hypothetical protein